MRKLTDAQYTAIIAAINSQKHDRAAYLGAATKIRLGFGGAYGINADIPSSMNEWRSDKDKSIRLIEQYQSACDKAESAFIDGAKPAGNNEHGVEMSEHTKEPWYTSETDDGLIEITNDERNGAIVAIAEVSTGYNGQIGIEQEANARRIVACINACAGFNTGQLENVLLFGDTLKQRFMVLSNLETELRCQRDGLLLALEYAIRQHQGLATVQGIAMAIEAVKGTET